MSEANYGVAGELLKEVLYAWRDRNQRIAVKEANSLTFWRDGMLEQINEIAHGKATKKTFDELKRNFELTEEPVAKSLAKLRELRERIVDGRIGDKLDGIINNPHYGKNTVRQNIQYILDHHRKSDVRNAAAEASKAIEILNAELRALFRMVYRG